MSPCFVDSDRNKKIINFLSIRCQTLLFWMFFWLWGWIPFWSFIFDLSIFNFHLIRINYFIILFCYKLLNILFLSFCFSLIKDDMVQKLWLYILYFTNNFHILHNFWLWSLNFIILKRSQITTCFDLEVFLNFFVL